MRLLLSYEIDPATGKPALQVREGTVGVQELQSLEAELGRYSDRLARWDGKVVEVWTKLRAFGEGPARFRVHVARGGARNPALWLQSIDASGWVKDFIAEARGVVGGLARGPHGVGLEEVARECARLEQVAPKRLALRLLAGYLEHMHHNGPAGLGVLDCECPACALRKAANQGPSSRV